MLILHSIWTCIPLYPIILAEAAETSSSQTLPLPEPITSHFKMDNNTTSTSGDAALRSRVENRLCSNKSVAEAVKATVAWVMCEDGARLPSVKKVVQPLLESANDSSTTKRPKQERSVVHIFAGKKLSGVGNQQAVDGEDLSSDPEDVAADAAGWESGSISDNDQIHEIPPAIDDSEDDEGDDEIPEPIKPSKKVKVPTAQPSKSAKTVVTSSTFLPSLSAGFTLGDSDSDPDLDPDVDGSGLVGNQAVRKNRRGQRARQA